MFPENMRQYTNYNVDQYHITRDTQNIEGYNRDGQILQF